MGGEGLGLHKPIDPGPAPGYPWVGPKYSIHNFTCIELWGYGLIGSASVLDEKSATKGRRQNKPLEMLRVVQRMAWIGLGIGLGGPGSRGKIRGSGSGHPVREVPWAMENRKDKGPGIHGSEEWAWGCVGPVGMDPGMPGEPREWSGP